MTADRDNPSRVRAAGVDCGTNSIRLLVADVDAEGSMQQVARRMEVVRLGAGVDRTGAIAPESMERTLAMAREYAAQCASYGVHAVRFVATSASRDASNAAEFIAGVSDAFSQWEIRPEVVTVDEEARLSFVGATAGLPADLERPLIVVDLGGGSTELVRGSGDVEAARSMDIGCVRITERHLHSDPPTAAEIAAAQSDIDAALESASAAVDLDRVGTLVGLAGSVTTITAHALRLQAYDPAAIHLAALPAEQVVAACDDLLHMTRAERTTLPFMHPGRVDVIGAGALIWSTIVRRVSVGGAQGPVVTSERDILDGITLSAAAQARTTPAER